jgi:anti-sigma28 factor (negative regulator of flagellin synthesis)/quinol monooxygenase YgiN
MVSATTGGSSPALTITGATLDAKTYDGSTTATVTGVTFSGGTPVIGTDYTATAVFTDNANAGTAKTATVTVALTGTGAAKYTLATPTFALTAQTIAKAPTADLLATFMQQVFIAQSTTGSGTVDLSGMALASAHPYGTVGYALGTFMPIDNVVTSSPTLVGSSLGYTYTSTSTGTVNETSVQNITISTTNYADKTVQIYFLITDKTPVVISGVSVPAKVYDGTPAAPTGIGSEVITGGTPTQPLEYYYSGTAADGTYYASGAAPTKAGTYDLRIETDATDGVRGLLAIPFVIAKRPLTFAAADQTVTVGDAPPATYTYTVSGLVSGDAENDVILTAPSATCAYTSASPAGGYPVTLSGAALNAFASGDKGYNYEIAYVNGTLTATSTFDVSIGAFTGGSVSASPNANVTAGTTVTLTAIPEAGYELNTISVKRTGDASVEVSLNGFNAPNALNGTFTMPAYGVTITATFQKTADQTAVEAAQALIEGMTGLTVAQATANDETAVKNWLATQINGLSGMSATGITVSASDIALSSFTEATAGTPTAQPGTDGSFSFTVSLTKGASSAATANKNGVITATAYDSTQDNADIAAAKAAIEGASYGPVPQATLNTQAAAKAQVEAIIAALNLNGVTATVIDGSFTAAIAGTTGNLSGTNGFYTFTVNLSKGGGTQQTTATLTLTITATPLVNAQTPAISGQPQNRTVNAGSSASLTVTASVTDGGTLSYQWYRNTTNSASGGTAVGSNNSRYSPSTASAGTYYYYVVVTNTNNSVNGTKTTTATSAVATVTVNVLVNAQTPDITEQPQSASYMQDDAADALTVTAIVGDGGTLSYQWYRNTVNSNSGGEAVGTNSDSYSPSTGSAGTYWYYVKVTNTNNSVNGSKTATATSQPVSITVTAIVDAQTPVISVQPQSRTVNAGESVTLSVTASVSDGGTLSYQWYRNTANSNSGGTAVGTNSSYSPPTASASTYYYYVTVKNTNNSVNGSTTASVRSAVVAVTVIRTYPVTIATTTNGTVSANKTTAPAGETVTLTVSPATGYELDAISTTPSVSLNGFNAPNALNGTFTMPASDITVKASFKKTQAQLDKETVEAAKAAIEGGTYRVAQATANEHASVKTWLTNTLNVLFGQSHDIQLRAATASTVGEVTVSALTPAIAGTKTATDGTHGAFTFTIDLTRGATTLTATVPSGVIVATPHASTEVKRIELSLTGLTAHILNTGNVATGELTLALTGTNPDAFTLPQETVNTLAIGGEADITITPNAGLAAGTYTATLTVSGEGITPVSVEITYTVTITGIDEVQAKALKAYIQNGRLHVSGLDVGKIWGIYSVSGALIYQSLAHEDKAEVSLSVRGVYIVKSGNAAVKVAY